MAGSFTANLNLYKPEVGADFDTWGNAPVGINGDQDKIDDVFKPAGDGTAVGLNVASTKTLSLAGTLAMAATGLLTQVSGAVAKFLSSGFQLLDSTDPTKIVQFDVSGMPTATTSSVRIAGGNVSMGVPVGSIFPYFLPTAPAGWVFLRGLTVGSALSGATERANDDCLRLFTALWNTNAYAVHPSRGGSAAADWAANRTIDMPDMRAVAPVGMDNMGGGAARNLIPSLDVLGERIGAASAQASVFGYVDASGSASVSGTLNGTITSGTASAGGTSGGANYAYLGNSVSVNGSLGGSASVAGTIRNDGNNLTSGFGIIQPTIGVNYITPL